MTLNFKYSPEDVIKLSEIESESEYNDAELAELEALYAGTFNSIQDETLVKGTITSIQDRYVLVDIGFKSEGIVDRDEFAPSFDLKVGVQIEVFMDEVENSDGQLHLSYKKALFMHTWAKVLDHHENQDIVTGTCIRRIKGGIVVNLMGIDAFLPGSQIDVKPIRDFDAYIGKDLDFRIVKVNHARKNIVVSSRSIIEESLSSQRDEILKTLEVGEVREGQVKNITDFGVFIDLGGVDGLLHITDLSWGRVNHPSEIVKLDEKLNVKILDFDKERKRISLGLKQLIPHPWEGIESKYPEGGTIKGKIVSIADYGAFVELDKGVEGLIHISEMSWTQNVKHPSQVVSIGDEIDALVLSIDQETKKISLGLKQLEDDPWEDLEGRYPVGSKHKGIVRNLTAFGAFIELEEGVDGLVHISDFSWTKKLRHPSEFCKKGDELEVLVLSIDRGERRIALGHKQVLDNPWDNFEAQHPIGSELTAPISKLLEKGVTLDLPFDLEGFVPINQLGVDKIKKPSDNFSEGQELKGLITEIDVESKRIIVSVRALNKRAEGKNIEEFQSNSNKPTTIGDIIKAQQEEAEKND